MWKYGIRRLLCVLVAAAMVSAFALVAAGPAAACGYHDWYLPEGYTGGNFDTYILLQNPNGWDAEAEVRFLLEGSASDPLKVELPASSRTTIKVDEEPGMEDAAFSTMVSADSGVVAERAMYFTYEGERAGGSNSIGANRTSAIWYLAEGYTGGGFDTYVLVMNPNDRPVDVKCRFFTPKAGEGAGRTADPHPSPEPTTDPVAEEPDYIEREYTIDALRRLTIHVDEIPGLADSEVSTVVYVTGSGSGGEEVPGVVAERSVYFDYMGIDGGHCSIGAPCASTTWYLPEGRTADAYDTYILVMNPNAVQARVRATFMVPSAGAGRTADPHDPVPDDPTEKPDDDPVDYKPDPDPDTDDTVVREFLLEPYERFTIPVDYVEGLESTDVATMVESVPLEQAGAGGAASPVVVERAMYFARGDDGDGHNSMGATTRHEYWLMAEGYTGGRFDTWILIQNPNSHKVTVKATFMTPDDDPVEKKYEIPARTRKTIAVDGIDGLEDAEVSTKLQVLPGEDYAADCSYGIIAERAVYFDYNGVMGGHCSLGLGE
jgi:hypothetical protein